MPYRIHPRYRGLGASTPPATVQSALQSASSSYSVPLSLLTAVAKRESGFNPAAVGSAGEQGLMQIMPANDASLGLSDPFDPVQSANAGAKYLSQLYSTYGDWNTALIAYNEGPGNLSKSGVFPASQSYADSIMADAGISSVLQGDQGSGTPAVDPSSLDSSGSPIDTSGSGLSTGAMLGLVAAAVAVVWWAAG